MVVEFPVADGRLFPYLTAGGGVGRVTERFGAGDDLIPWVPVDSISNQPSPEHASGSDPGIVNSDTAYFFDRMAFPVSAIARHSDSPCRSAAASMVDFGVDWCWRSTIAKPGRLKRTP